MGKACHPLTAILFLKEEEGRTHDGNPIRPATVSARVHALTRLPGYRDAGHLRADYEDIEDCGMVHVTFTDGTVADVFASEVVLGGVYNWLEVFANNHRTRCNLNPIDALQTYNPREEQFDDVYVVEKIGTRQGWSRPAPDEDWMHGYPQELAHFYGCFAGGTEPQCGAELGFVTTAVLYAAYRSAEQGGAEVPVAEVAGHPVSGHLGFILNVTDVAEPGSGRAVVHLYGKLRDGGGAFLVARPPSAALLLPREQRQRAGAPCGCRRPGSGRPANAAGRTGAPGAAAAARGCARVARAPAQRRVCAPSRRTCGSPIAT